MAFTLTGNPLLEDRLRSARRGPRPYNQPGAGGRGEYRGNYLQGRYGPYATNRGPGSGTGKGSKGGSPKGVRRPGPKPGEMGAVENFDRSILSGDQPFWWATEEGMYNYENWRAHFAGLEQLPDYARDRIEKDREKLEGMAQALLGEDYSLGKAFQLWNEAIDEAEAGSMVGSPRTPWEVLERWSSDGDAFNKESGLGESIAGYQGPRVITRTQRSINLTDPKTAEAVAMDAAKRELGRRPTDDEFAEFLAALNNEERANPTISTTTTNLDEEGQEVSSSTETSGGTVNPTGMAANWIDEEHNVEADVMRAANFLSVLQGL